VEAYADRETRERQRLQAENVALEGQVGAAACGQCLLVATMINSLKGQVGAAAHAFAPRLHIICRVVSWPCLPAKDRLSPVSPVVLFTFLEPAWGCVLQLKAKEREVVALNSLPPTVCPAHVPSIRLCLCSSRPESARWRR